MVVDLEGLGQYNRAEMMWELVMASLSEDMVKIWSHRTRHLNTAGFLNEASVVLQVICRPK